MNILTPVSMAALLLWGCEKEENQVYFEGGTKPGLTASTAAVVLKPGTAAEEAAQAIKFTWTNPNYKFTTGISSQDVHYTLELDKAGSNFASANKYSITISRELSKAFTIAELNGILGNNMGLPTGVQYNLQARVTSKLQGNALPLVSDPVAFTATPFDPPPVVEPPTESTLWATGNAFASGWANPLPSPYNVSQKFTKISNTLYEATLDFVGGGNFKLIQKPGEWSSQYHMIDGGTADGGSFRKRDSEPGFIGPAVAGKYKMTVNFQTGKFTVVKQ